jgi:hypothetical protein
VNTVARRDVRSSTDEQIVESEQPLSVGQPGQALRMEWEDPRLLFAIREPFVSRHSAASVVAGWIDEREQIVIESTMPSGGVIFSDGIENDFLRFDSGAIASIHPAAVRAQLVTEPKAR